MFVCVCLVHVCTSACSWAHTEKTTWKDTPYGVNSIHLLLARMPLRISKFLHYFHFLIFCNAYIIFCNNKLFTKLLNTHNTHFKHWEVNMPMPVSLNWLLVMLNSWVEFLRGKIRIRWEEFLRTEEVKCESTVSQLNQYHLPKNYILNFCWHAWNTDLLINLQRWIKCQLK